MKTIRNTYYIQNSVFVVCLLTLIVNDHYLKYTFSNWLTGKLSDAVGIIILPLLLAFLLPRLKLHAIWISPALFTFWKSPFSQTLINLYNDIAFIQTSRTVDISDLFVLILLPIPYYIIDKIDNLGFIKIQKVNNLFILLPTVISLMATSMPPSHYYKRTNGNLVCYGCDITVNYNQDEIIERLKNADIVFDSIAPVDSIAIALNPGLEKQNAHAYRLNQLVIDKDTLRNLDFTMRTIKNGETKIHFNGMQVSDDISTKRMQNQLRKRYKKMLFKELRSKLQE